MGDRRDRSPPGARGVLRVHRLREVLRRRWRSCAGDCVPPCQARHRRRGSKKETSTGRYPDPCRSRRSGSRDHSQRSGRGQSHERGCRIRGSGGIPARPPPGRSPRSRKSGSSITRAAQAGRSRLAIAYAPSSKRLPDAARRAAPHGSGADPTAAHVSVSRIAEERNGVAPSSRTSMTSPVKFASSSSWSPSRPSASAAMRDGSETETLRALAGTRRRCRAK